MACFRRSSRRTFLRLMGALAPVWSVPVRAAHPPSAQERDGQADISLIGRKYRFEPARIEVRQNDLVRVTFETRDIAHSFTCDAYRIAKRASPGSAITFEFRADRAGTFPFYCNLTVDEGCRAMRGELVVRPR